MGYIAASIPTGTIQATVFTFGVYSLLLVLAAATTSREVLQNNYGFMQVGHFDIILNHCATLDRHPTTAVKSLYFHLVHAYWMLIGACNSMS